MVAICARASGERSFSRIRNAILAQDLTIRRHPRRNHATCMSTYGSCCTRLAFSWPGLHRATRRTQRTQPRRNVIHACRATWTASVHRVGWLELEGEVVALYCLERDLHCRNAKRAFSAGRSNLVDTRGNGGQPTRGAEWAGARQPMEVSVNGWPAAGNEASGAPPPLRSASGSAVSLAMIRKLTRLAGHPVGRSAQYHL